MQARCCGKDAQFPWGSTGAGTEVFWSTVAAEDGICLARGLAWSLHPRLARDFWSPPRLCSRSEEALRQDLPRSGVSLLLLERVFAPRTHLQLLFSQVLLDFINSETTAVQKRVWGRIRNLSHGVGDISKWEVRPRHLPARPYRPPCCSSHKAAIQLAASEEHFHSLVHLAFHSLVSPRSIPKPCC